MLQSATAHTSPKIVKVDRSPETPNYDQLVTITVQVKIEKASIDSVILCYWVNDTNWVDVSMNLDAEWKEDDGKNGWWWDICNNWGVWSDDNYYYANYVAEIPTLPYNIRVKYKVYVSDIHGNYDVSERYSYLVDDFVPPIISDILQVPASPMPYEAVTVSATVTEPPDASGVKNIIPVVCTK
jgi:hypothetical protein